MRRYLGAWAESGPFLNSQRRVLARIIHEYRREAFEPETRWSFSQVRPTQAYVQSVEEADEISPAGREDKTTQQVSRNSPSEAECARGGLSARSFRATSRGHPESTGGSVYGDGDRSIQHLEQQIPSQSSSPATEDGHIKDCPILLGFHEHL